MRPEYHFGTRSSSTPQAVSTPGQADAEPMLQELFDAAPGEPTGMASVDIESKIGNAYLPGGSALKISALMLVAGAALVGAALGLREEARPDNRMRRPSSPQQGVRSGRRSGVVRPSRL